MNVSVLIFALMLLAIASFVAGRARSLQMAGPAGLQALNSLPVYYGSLTAFWCALPGLLVVLVWGIFDDAIIRGMVQSMVPPALVEAAGGNLNLVMNQVHNISVGNVSSANQDPALLAAAERLQSLRQINRWGMTALAFSAALVGGLLI